jgi:hypothetical protein
MRRFFQSLLLVVAISVVVLIGLRFQSGHADGEQPTSMKIEAPGFEGIDAWINSKPQTWKDLKGQVVVVHFWTFG